MNVTLKVAHLVIDNKEVPLTLKIVKQFPILPRHHRYDQSTSKSVAPEPIAKIWRSVLDKDASDWMYLVDEPGYGLCWVYPVLYFAADVEKIKARGIWIDDPSMVPTLTLL